MLRRVASLPVTEWKYIGHQAQCHIGLTAQDWHAAFPLNDSDTALNTADLHGVYLAAIQGSVEELKDCDAQNEQLTRKIEAIDERLNALPPAP